MEIGEKKMSMTTPLIKAEVMAQLVPPLNAFTINRSRILQVTSTFTNSTYDVDCYIKSSALFSQVFCWLANIDEEIEKKEVLPIEFCGIEVYLKVASLSKAFGLYPKSIQDLALVSNSQELLSVIKEIENPERARVLLQKFESSETPLTEVKNWLDCLDELYGLVEKKFSLVTEFLRENIEKKVSSKEECFFLLQREKRKIACALLMLEKNHPSSLEGVQTLAAAWKNKTLQEEEMQKVAKRVAETAKIPFPIAIMHVREASKQERGSLFRRDFIVVGRLDSGDLFVGKFHERVLGHGENLNVHAINDFTAEAGKINRYVFKRQKREDKDGLLHEDTMLKIIHGAGRFPHIASPLIGKTFVGLRRNITEALQEREGPDIFTLLAKKDSRLLSVEVLWTAVKAARTHLREKGIGNLDVKIENLVLSSDGRTVKLIDLDKAFMKRPVIQEIRGFTPDSLPLEGLKWLANLIYLKDQLTDWDNFSLEKLQGLSLMASRNLETENKKEFEASLQNHMIDTVEKLEDFQDGFLLWLYINHRVGDSDRKGPYPEGSFNGDVCNRVSNIQDDLYNFLKPHNFEEQPLFIQKTLKKHLNPMAFLDMKKKHRTIRAAFSK